ncbi:hypothetical protein, partial [Campylobacter mucosalis]|uniref:hypothetical protein n=1 Tax=Campylobacter mucosalis TaxID=202 RepID=UPI0014700EF1
MLLQVIVFCSLFVCDNLCNITLTSNQDTIITGSNLNAENTITKQTTLSSITANKSNNQSNNKTLNYTHSKT